jgi:ubiquinone/menaquinone biosynthesis C-methylase UbiE
VCDEFGVDEDGNGLITALPFADDMAEIVMAGHVFGDEMEAELTELRRVTRPGGMILLCPGSSLTQVAAHRFLVAHGFSWSEFEEPGDGTKRKYWLQVVKSGN